MRKIRKCEKWKKKYLEWKLKKKKNNKKYNNQKNKMYKMN